MRCAFRLFKRNETEQELDEELRFHIDMATDLHRSAGMTEREARRQALRDFGGIEKTKEFIRDANGFRPLTDLLRDVRYAFRGLQRRTTFSLATITTIAVAVACTAIVVATLVQVLWKPLPNQNADRIVVLRETDLATGDVAEGVSPGNLLEWQARNTTYDAIGIAEPWSVDIDVNGRPETRPAWQVSMPFVKALGLQPILGRNFRAEDYESATPSATMLSHGAWLRMFDGDPAILDKLLVLDGASVRVVGVLPGAIGFPQPRDFWLPRPAKPRDARMRTGSWMTAIGVVASNATLDAAQQDLNRIAQLLANERPETNKDVGVRLQPLREHLLEAVGPAMQALGVAAAIFFLAACATVASMFSTRLHAQAGELAMRGALGADQPALVQQVFVEIFVVCSLGASLGLLMATLLVEFLASTLPTGLPRLNNLQFDATLVWSGLGLAALMGLCVAAISVFQINRASFSGLRDYGRTTGKPNEMFARSALIAAQIAVASVLLVGANLMVRSLSNFLSNEIGFEPDNRVALTMFGDHTSTPGERIVYFRTLMESLREIPGIIDVAATSALPFHPTQIESETPFAIVDDISRNPEERTSAHAMVATPGYFSLMNIAIVEGREFDDFDRHDTAQVAVVNQTLAERYWPGHSPIGTKVRIRVLGVVAECEIVGVVGDTRATSFDSPPRSEFFVPHAQHGGAALTIVARTANAADRMLPTLQETIWEKAPQQAIYTSTTVAALVAKSTEARDFAVRTLGAFAIGAVGLAVLGIYSLVSYTVTLRKREFGIRMAIGAPHTQVQRDAARHAFGLTAIGVIVGMAITASVAAHLAPLLYGVDPWDWPTYLSAAIFIVLASLTAAWAPAWIATRKSPASLLNTP